MARQLRVAHLHEVGVRQSLLRLLAALIHNEDSVVRHAHLLLQEALVNLFDLFDFLPDGRLALPVVRVLEQAETALRILDQVGGRAFQLPKQRECELILEVGRIWAEALGDHLYLLLAALV